jgi:hypothetical protein
LVGLPDDDARRLIVVLYSISGDQGFMVSDLRSSVTDWIHLSRASAKAEYHATALGGLDPLPGNGDMEFEHSRTSHGGIKIGYV